MDEEEKLTYHRQEPKGIDRLFLSLATIYGKRWFDQWAGVDMEAMKETWTKSLQGLQAYQIHAALDYCADHENYVPTLPRFREICDQMRRSDPVKALPRKFTEEELANNQERVKQAFKKLEQNSDYKKWARKIISNPNGKPDIAIKFAQEAIGMKDENSI